MTRSAVYAAVRSATAAAISFALVPAAPAAAQSVTDDLMTRQTLTGDWGGVRTQLEDHGITLGLTWTGEGLGNTSGGVKRGFTYDGLVEFDADFDLDKLLGWTGGTVHASAYWIQGRGLSTYYLGGNILTVSSIEADADWRLNELYFEQSLFDGALSIRAGQIAADSEFWISDTAGLFINSTFGWPGINGTDLPNGEAAYPLPTPGVRVKWAPNDTWTVMGAVFNGDPDPDGTNNNGLEFPVGDGVFAIFEASYAYAPDNGLSGTWKAGVWYNSEDFDNLLYAANGYSLANPLAAGGPRQEDGDYSIYAIVDHQLWRKPDSDDGGLSGFLRVGVTPEQDRNPVNWYFDTGLAFTGPFPGREDDIVGIGFAYANMSPDLAELNRLTNAVTGVDAPVVDYEAAIEVSYQANFTPWVSVQPFVQYIFHPGGNIANPDGSQPTVALKDAFLFGMRMAIVF